jgi:hypothetical protein
MEKHHKKKNHKKVPYEPVHHAPPKEPVAPIYHEPPKKHPAAPIYHEPPKKHPVAPVHMPAAPVHHHMPVAPAHHMPPTHVPTKVAPARRVVHPTRVVERHTVTRYPVKNIFPTHVKHIHHHVCEQYCSYPYSESTHDAVHHVNVTCGPNAGYPAAGYPTAGYHGKKMYR